MGRIEPDVKQRLWVDGAKSAPVTIHLVSLGSNIPFASDYLTEHNKANTYVWAPGYNDLRTALASDSNTNVLFLNCAVTDFQKHLDANESFIRQCNPLIVADKHISERARKATVSEYGIKFIPFGCEVGDLQKLPERLVRLLQERVVEAVLERV